MASWDCWRLYYWWRCSPLPTAPRMCAEMVRRLRPMTCRSTEYKVKAPVSIETGAILFLNFSKLPDFHQDVSKRKIRQGQCLVRAWIPSGDHDQELKCTPLLFR